jgi:hypothetical protein
VVQSTSVNNRRESERERTEDGVRHAGPNSSHPGRNELGRAGFPLSHRRSSASIARALHVREGGKADADEPPFGLALLLACADPGLVQKLGAQPHPLQIIAIIEAHPADRRASALLDPRQAA